MTETLPAPPISNSSPKPSGLRNFAAGIAWHEVAIPLAVLAIVLAMIAPVPAFVLDFLIAFNITLSVVVMLVGMNITRPVEFSVFPTALLLLTLFRLALNISSSRLILLDGGTGTGAAGHVIEAFGSFVVGGNYIIGTVIFLVLIAIQYVVINHGAVRISEVTARFTLDALPGKQMSIDSDLNAGLIDESEARRRRKELSAEAEFYGAMDGASRFTQRDAVASILITAINIAAGFLIGVLQHGMDLRRALETYTVLTIGDGLVTVIPSLMISVSGGMIVTRASADGRLGAEFGKQMLGSPEPILLASAVLLALAFFPGLPAIPFLVLGSGIGYLGWTLKTGAKQQQAAPAAATPAAVKDKDNLEPLLRVELLSVEVGLGLIRLVEGGANSPLLRRISGIRRQLAADLGYVVPPVRVTDNLSLKAGEYRISIKGIEVARHEIPQGFDLAIRAGSQGTPPDGMPTVEPAFGLAAWWIPSHGSDAARAAGFTVVDPVSILGTHLSEVIRRHAFELFSRQDAKRLTERVQEENPRVVEDLIPKLLSLAAVQRVLQNLLREKVSIRDATTILEALGDAGQVTKNTVLLTEYVRQALRRTVVQPYLGRDGEVAVYFLDGALEQSLESALEHGEQTSQIHLPPQRIREIIDRITHKLVQPDANAVILTSSPARYFLRQMVEPVLRNVHVLGHSEVPAGARVVSLGVIQ
jgi:flagellar biosynthesis protein FlhA